MKMIKQTTGYISSAMKALLAAALLLTSCVERELEVCPLYGDGNVEIFLNWGRLSDSPASVRCLFYDEADQLIKEARGVSGVARQTLPAGRYRLIVHNEANRQVSYRGTESYGTAEVFALPLSDTRIASSLPCILEPQTIYSTGICREGEWLVVRPHRTTRTTVNPTVLTRQVRFCFVIKGGVKVKTLAGTLNGVVPSSLLATGENGCSERCALRFVAVMNQTRQGEAVDADRITADLNVFNLLVTASSPAKMITTDLVLIDDADVRYDISVDLTSVLKGIIFENGGTMPVEVPVEVTIEKTVGDITSTVRPWDNSGTGSGGPTWD